jgi:hypothetical protein
LAKPAPAEMMYASTPAVLEMNSNSLFIDLPEYSFSGSVLVWYFSQLVFQDLRVVLEDHAIFGEKSNDFFFEH